MSSFEVDAAMPSPTEITVQQFARLMGLPGAPAIVDVRADEDFNANPRLLPTAQRHSSTGYGVVEAICRPVHCRGVSERQDSQPHHRRQVVAIEKLGLPFSNPKPRPFQPIMRRLAPLALPLYRRLDVKEI